MISGRRLDPSAHGSDDDLLMQRLAAAVRISNDRTTTGFRRRRSSGLLFQIRRRMRPAEQVASLMSPD